MTVRNLSLVATLRNGEVISLGSRTKGLKWREGRVVGSWYEQPSLLTITMAVDDDFITEDGSFYSDTRAYSSAYYWE